MDGREGLSITTMQSRKKKRGAGKVLAALAAAIVLTGLCLPAAYSLTDRAIPGVSYNGVRVSGMTREELGQVIERQAQSVPQGRIQLHYFKMSCRIQYDMDSFIRHCVHCLH